MLACGGVVQSAADIYKDEISQLQIKTKELTKKGAHNAKRVAELETEAGTKLVLDPYGLTPLSLVLQLEDQSGEIDMMRQGHDATLESSKRELDRLQDEHKTATQELGKRQRELNDLKTRFVTMEDELAKKMEESSSMQVLLATLTSIRQ